MIGTASGPGEHIFELGHEPQPPALGSWPRLAPGMNPVPRRMRDAYGSLEPHQASQCRGSIARGRRPAIDRFPCQMGHIETTAAFPAAGRAQRARARPVSGHRRPPTRAVLRPAPRRAETSTRGVLRPASGACSDQHPGRAQTNTRGVLRPAPGGRSEWSGARRVPARPRIPRPPGTPPGASHGRSAPAGRAS